jgi:hypothetical protein
VNFLKRLRCYGLGALKLFRKIEQPDIIFIFETYLNENMSNNDLKIENLDFERKHRNERDGVC